MPYRLEGSILEVCNCQVLCPCWIGEDPDQGTCDSVLAYHFDRGDINGVDVSGLTLAFVAHIPGNVLDGGFRVVIVVDDRASIEEEAALDYGLPGTVGGSVGGYVAVNRRGFGGGAGTDNVCRRSGEGEAGHWRVGGGGY